VILIFFAGPTFSVNGEAGFVEMGVELSGGPLGDSAFGLSGPDVGADGPDSLASRLLRI
jgi:hypothetical protein